MRDVALIIDELAEAAAEQDIDADSLSQMVRDRAIEVDIREAGDVDELETQP